MKALIVLILLLGLALVWGAQNVYLGLRDDHPIEITCAEYLAHPPDGRWVKLTECDEDFSRMSVVFDGGTMDAIYVPMRPHGVVDGPARIVVQHDDDLDAVHQQQARPTEAFRRNASTAQGMLRTGFLDDMSDDARERLARELGLGPDFAIVRLGSRPHIWLGLLALCGGLAGVAGGVFLIRRWRS